MSEARDFGLIMAEKFFGFMLIIIGALTMYYTLTSTQSLTDYTGFFGFLALLFLIIGGLLIIIKIE